IDRLMISLTHASQRVLCSSDWNNIFHRSMDMRDATSKASIVFRSIMAFNLSRGGLDWAGVARSPNSTQEDHHIFPRDWLGKKRDERRKKQYGSHYGIQ